MVFDCGWTRTMFLLALLLSSWWRCMVFCTPGQDVAAVGQIVVLYPRSRCSSCGADSSTSTHKLVASCRNLFVGNVHSTFSFVWSE
jgi:hypothetical protein